MAGKILFTDRTNAGTPTGATTEVAAAQMNEIKNVVNANADTLDSLTSTGVIYGGRGTVTGGNGASDTVDITAGACFVLDNTDAENPILNLYSWTLKSALTLNNTGVISTWWYVDDNSDTIKQQTTEPTNSERRTKAFLFRTGFLGGVITSTFPEVILIQQSAASLKRLADAIGIIKLQGLQPVPSTGTLNLKVTSGVLFEYAINYNDSYTDTHDNLFAGIDTAVSGTFFYGIPSGLILGSPETEYDVGNYAPGGVVTPIPGSGMRVGLHFVWMSSSSGNFAVTYGENYYTSVPDAESAIGAIDPFANSPFDPNSIIELLGVAIIAKNETDTANSTFIGTNKFGLFGGGLAIAGGSFLEIANNLDDVSDKPQALINLGAASINRISQTLNFVDFSTFFFTQGQDYKINSVAEQNGVTATILLGGTDTPYVLGDTVTAFEALDITVNALGAITIIGELL